MKKMLFFAAAMCCLASCKRGGEETPSKVFNFSHADTHLYIELLDDDLVNVQYQYGDSATFPQESTIMVAKTDYKGATAVSYYKEKGVEVIETSDLKLKINPETLGVSFIDKTKNNAEITAISPNKKADALGLEASCPADLVVYGLGQQFTNEGYKQLSYNGKVREGNEFGNVMAWWDGGCNGNSQFPIMYAMNGAGHENYALFLDNTFKLVWDFTAENSWNVSHFGGNTSYYFMSGKDLLDLRKDYLELTGHPTIPPKKMFGMWVSEYGFDDWDELDSKLTTLQENEFPIDGFVMDLQWFGGIGNEGDASHMGSLTWDAVTYPDPKGKLASLEKDHGVGIMLIEEPYVDQKLPDYEEFNSRGLLVSNADESSAALFPEQEWWGSGGMFDYTNPETGKYVFDHRRKALIEDGVLGHWTDLGEPEVYNSEAIYFGGKSQKEAHNIYNIHWIKGIFDGYKRNGIRQRPFIMSRSGISGVQRYSAAMWSADIGGKMMSLVAHAMNQTNMSFSGIDYYGADLGGFHRQFKDEGKSYDELYTKWFAYGMLFDVPVRPHAQNLKNNIETAPDRVGDVASNLSNSRQRYAMLPYYYSLAFKAAQEADPVIAPLVCYFQADPRVADIFDQKMIGPYLMGVAETEYDRKTRDVYLPEGTWYDWHNHEKLNSRGELKKDVALYRTGKFKLPIYVREGAIIPLAYVDGKTMNAQGRRSDGSVRNELIVKVFPSLKATDFTLYEDNGWDVSYQEGTFTTTKIIQQLAEGKTSIIMQAAEGMGEEKEKSRQLEMQVVTEKFLQTVKLNGKELKKVDSHEALQSSQESVWLQPTSSEVFIRTVELPNKQEKRFELE